MTNEDMVPSPNKYTVRIGIILLVAEYLLGMLTGWGVGLSPKDRAMGIGISIGAFISAAFFVWVYFSSDGRMNQTGFGRAKRK